MPSFLRPNTPHIAVALDNTIIFGGFYYSFRNLRDTLSGLVHSFVYGESITSLNGPQPGDTSSLLFRMLQYLYKFFVQGTDPQSGYIRIPLQFNLPWIYFRTSRWAAARFGQLRRPLQRPGALHLRHLIKCFGPSHIFVSRAHDPG